MFGNLCTTLSYYLNHRFSDEKFVEDFDVSKAYDDLSWDSLNREKSNKVFINVVEILLSDQNYIKNLINVKSKKECIYNNGGYENRYDIGIPYKNDESVLCSTKNNALWLPMLQKGYIQCFGMNFETSDAIDVLQNIVNLPFIKYTQEKIAKEINEFEFNEKEFYIVKFNNDNNFYRLMTNGTIYKNDATVAFNQNELCELYAFKNEYTNTKNIYFDIDEVKLMNLKLEKDTKLTFFLKHHIDTNSMTNDFIVLVQCKDKDYSSRQFTNNYFMRMELDLKVGEYDILVIPKNPNNYHIDFNVTIQSQEPIEFTEVDNKDKFYELLDQYWVNYYENNKDEFKNKDKNDEFGLTVYEFDNKELNSKILMVTHDTEDKYILVLEDDSGVIIKENLKFNNGNHEMMINNKVKSIFLLNDEDSQNYYLKYTFKKNN